MPNYRKNRYPHQLAAQLNTLSVNNLAVIGDWIILQMEASKNGQDRFGEFIRLILRRVLDEGRCPALHAQLCVTLIEQMAGRLSRDSSYVGTVRAQRSSLLDGELFRRQIFERCHEKRYAAFAAYGSSSKKKCRSRCRSRCQALFKFLTEAFKVRLMTEKNMHRWIERILYLFRSENTPKHEIESFSTMMQDIGWSLYSNNPAQMGAYFARMKKLAESMRTGCRVGLMLLDIVKLYEGWRSKAAVTRTVLADSTEFSIARTVLADSTEFSVARTMLGVDSTEFSIARTVLADSSEFFIVRDLDEGEYYFWGLAPELRFRLIDQLVKTAIYGKESDAWLVGHLFNRIASKNICSATSFEVGFLPTAKNLHDIIFDAPTAFRLMDIMMEGACLDDEQWERIIAAHTESSIPDPELENSMWMSEAAVAKTVLADSNEFFAVRNLDRGEYYFRALAPEHRFRLVDQLVKTAIYEKEPAVWLVSHLFGRVVSENLCSAASFEEGFLPTAKHLRYICVDTPKAFDLMETMMRGAGLDDEQWEHIAAAYAESSIPVSELENSGWLPKTAVSRTVLADSNEFFVARNLDEGEYYFRGLAPERHFRLVDQLVKTAIYKKEPDAWLVAHLFGRVVSRKVCSAASFEEGFLPTAKNLHDIVIDAPKAFDLMEIMMRGAVLNEEQWERIVAAHAESPVPVSKLEKPKWIPEAAVARTVIADSNEFFEVRSLDEGEYYFQCLAPECRFRLVDQLVKTAIYEQEPDAWLVARLFGRAVSKKLCSAASFEEGFLPTAKTLHDIIIDAPKAFDLMVTMMGGAGLDDEQWERIVAAHTQVADCDFTLTDTKDNDPNE